jgi:hypothetical protein
MQVTINGTDYEGYTTVAAADTYLAADPLHAATWDGRDEEDKGRAIIGATRLLSRLPLTVVVDMADPPAALQDATAVLAAAVAAKPKLSAGAGTGSNIKAVKAGPVDVQYFSPVREADALPVPQDVWDILVAANLIAGGDLLEVPVFLPPEREGYFITEDYFGYGLSERAGYPD